MTQREIFNQACKVTRTLLVTTAFVVLALPSFAHASFSFQGTPTATATSTSYYSVSVPIVSTTNESGVLVNYTLGGDTQAVPASFESGQTKTVTLTGVLPAKNYNVSIVRLDAEANVHELGTVGSFTVQLADKTTTVPGVFSMSQQPTYATSTNSNNDLVYTVDLFVKSSEVRANRSITITPTSGAAKTIFGDFLKENEQKIVRFGEVQPDVSYTVSVSAQGATSSETIGTFNIDSASKTVQYAPSTTNTTTSTSAQPVVKITSSNNANSSNASAATVPAGTTAPVVTQRYNPVSAITAGAGSCKDGIDNDGDGKIDYYGTNTAEPDPSCITPDSPEVKDDVSSKLIPCTDKCSFSDVFKLANNVIAFILTTLLIPIFVILIMYTGWQYLSSRGNPKANARAKKLALHLVIGLVLILCAWLIVRTILSSLGYTDGLLFFN